MYLLLTTCLVIIVIYIVSKRLSKERYGDIDKFPGPPTKIFFGNSLEFGTGPETLKNQFRIVKEYGLMVRIWLGSVPSLYISDPDKIQFLLSSNIHITKSKGYDGYKIWLGNGLINSAGDHWFKHRKIITPTFHFKILELYTEYENLNMKILFEKLHKEVGKPSTNIQYFIHYFALDVISEAAMRTKVNAQLNPKSEYVNAIKDFLRIYMSRYFSFYKQFDVLFKLTSDYAIQKNAVKTLKEFTANVITARLEERKNEKVDRGTNEFGIKKKIAFLDLLLDLEKENELTPDEIREEVDTFMFAGHDTVTSSTSFALYELAKHPEVQKALIEESNSVLGTDKNVDVTPSDLNNMRYLDMVLKECTRLFSPVPHIERELEEDVIFDDKLIPKGTTITILPSVLHKLEQFYPDPEKFDPDRFLPENCERRHPFAFIPFSAGPRNCIGMKYATTFVKIALTKILRNFEVLPAEPEHNPILINVAVLSSEDGINIQLKLRQ